MRRHLAAAALAAVALAGSGCGTEPDQSAADPDGGINSDTAAACAGFHRLVNEWTADYGAEMAAVGQAAAAGDEGREDTSVEVVKELFATTADGVREQADSVSGTELADALTRAADGLADIAEQIETYDDVENASDLMSAGAFGEAGREVANACVG